MQKTAKNVDYVHNMNNYVHTYTRTRQNMFNFASTIAYASSLTLKQMINSLTSNNKNL